MNTDKHIPSYFVFKAHCLVNGVPVLTKKEWIRNGAPKFFDYASNWYAEARIYQMILPVSTVH